MNSIRFSVVIPTYNRGRLTLRAIASALSQTHAPAEVIVVDDGSEDDTRALIAALGDNVRYIHQVNQGSAVARNRGMREARCDWIALLDSDDLWRPSHLASMAAAIQRTNGRARFYFADTLRPVDKGAGSRWQAVGFSIAQDFQLAEIASEWVLHRPQPMMLQSTVFNKAAFMESGGFLPLLRYRDDTHLFLKLGLNAPACAVKHIGAEMTSDDVPTNRLTLSHNGQLRGAQMRIAMLNDLLRSEPDLPGEVRQELKRRLAFACLAVARHSWKTRNYRLAVTHFIDSVIAKPSVAMGRVQQNLQNVASS